MCKHTPTSAMCGGGTCSVLGGNVPTSYAPDKLMDISSRL